MVSGTPPFVSNEIVYLMGVHTALAVTSSAGMVKVSKSISAPVVPSTHFSKVYPDLEGVGGVTSLPQETGCERIGVLSESTKFIVNETGFHFAVMLMSSVGYV